MIKTLSTIKISSLTLHTPFLARLCFVVLCILAATTGHTKTKEINKPAYDFTLKSNTGKNIRLAELRGQVVMINFWASWCGPCRQEMPYLDALYQRYNPAGFTLLGVNVEPDPKSADILLKDIPVSFPILYDTTSKVSKAYGVDAMPSTVLVDCDGNARYVHRGYKPGDEKQYKKLIKTLLKQCG